ncbi:MAG: metallophosphoesterase [Candidatus Lokiarchaeota archaeon]|nr:metallophosphoesterase [Candidatus Harpocratesius repetitus]
MKTLTIIILYGSTWLFLIIFYATIIFQQRYMLRWYVLKKLRIKVSFFFLLLFSYSGVEISFFFLFEEFFLSQCFCTLILSFLFIFPIYLGFKLKRFYFDKNAYIPKSIKNWSNFGPYLIPHSINHEIISIFWGVRLPNKRKSKSRNESETPECNIIESNRVIHLGGSLDSLKKEKGQIIAKKKVQYLLRYDINLDQYPTGFFYRLNSICQKNEHFHISKKTIRYLLESKHISCFQKDKIEIVAISDLHSDINSIQLEADTIKKICPNADLVISSGDNISNAYLWTNWGRFFAPFRDYLATRPFLTCSGNHDADMRVKIRNWQRLFPYTEPSILPPDFYRKDDLYYSLDFGSVILFFIDLYNGGRKPRIPNSNQMERFVNDLKRSQVDKIKILIMHNSIFCTGEFGCDNELADIFLPIIDAYNIPLVISGHAHIFEAFHRVNPKTKLETLFIVNGGGGGKLDDIILQPKSFVTVPYRWESTIHRAQIKPYLGGRSSSAFRNDEAVEKYQQFGIIAHSWVRIQIKEAKIKVTTFDWNGKPLYEKSISALCL